jgi:hypothetical protein
MDNKEKIKKIITEKSNGCLETISKDLKHEFIIENVKDKNRGDNGMYDLDYFSMSTIKHYIQKKLNKNKNYSLLEYENLSYFCGFLRDESRIQVGLKLGNNYITESKLSGTVTSCAIALVNGISISRISSFCKYLTVNEIDIIELFREYFLQIMNVNNITQLIFSNQIYSHNYGVSSTLFNLVLNELCQTKTEVHINKNGGNNVCTWIFTDIITEYEDKIIDDHDDNCDCEDGDCEDCY